MCEGSSPWTRSMRPNISATQPRSGGLSAWSSWGWAPSTSPASPAWRTCTEASSSPCSTESEGPAFTSTVRPDAPAAPRWSLRTSYGYTVGLQRKPVRSWRLSGRTSWFARLSWRCWGSITSRCADSLAKRARSGGSDLILFLQQLEDWTQSFIWSHADVKQSCFLFRKILHIILYTHRRVNAELIVLLKSDSLEFYWEMEGF